jgi:amylosucrase
LLIHNIILTIGGIPLIYLGDEIGTLNDYSFREDPARRDDSRWVHRTPAAPQLYEQRNEPQTIPGRIYQSLRHLIDRRKKEPLFASDSPIFIDCGNPYVFGYIRHAGHRQILLLNNFSDFEQTVSRNALRLSGLGSEFLDVLSNETVTLEEDLTLKPFQFMWLRDKLSSS